ncbi:hypothetical protein [Serratia bockelmannii]|uniref:hypothetical protein n=1 Tax=Serratia bockelmannii TaxID=2703793 RepID=UPI003FA6E4CB
MKTSLSFYARHTLLLMAIAMMTACAAVSFTHADDVDGGSITNAEVQPGSTVVLTYPDGSACIDTRSREGRACQSMAQPASASPATSVAQGVPAVPVTPEVAE